MQIGSSKGHAPALFVIVAAVVAWSFQEGTARASCGSPVNAIEAENCRPGNPASEWDVSGSGDANLQGFATDISVNRGETVSFKIDTTASAYRIDIYRLGYYDGHGARQGRDHRQHLRTVKTNQPACLTRARRASSTAATGPSPPRGASRPTRSPASTSPGSSARPA